MVIFMVSVIMGICFKRTGLVERIGFFISIILLWISRDSVWLNVVAFCVAGATCILNVKRPKPEMEIA